jgi:hypothetical protein
MHWQIIEEDVCQGTLLTICSTIFYVLLLLIPDTNEQKLSDIPTNDTQTFFIKL